jgi:hypothetical protein
MKSRRVLHLIMVCVVYISQNKSYDLLKGESPPKGSYNKLALLEKTLNYKVPCVNTCLRKC